MNDKPEFLPKVLGSIMTEDYHFEVAILMEREIEIIDLLTGRWIDIPPTIWRRIVEIVQEDSEAHNDG